MTKIHNQHTIGSLIETLHRMPKDFPLAFVRGIYPGGFHSYRGYYEDLACEPTTYRVTVGEWLEKLKQQINATHTGWKGGSYTMNDETALWVSAHGDTGPAITKVLLKTDWVKLCLTHDD